MLDFQIGLYWKARPEELTLFVQNVYNTLKFLQSFNELFNSWYGLAMSKKKALERGISIDITFLMKLIEKKHKLHSDSDLSFSAWNGHDDDKGSSLSISTSSSTLFPSCFIFDFPEILVHSDGSSESDLIHLLKSLSAIWQPDYGTAFTNESMNLLIDEDRRARLFGGIFFLSNSIIPQSDDLKKFTLADKNRFGNIYSLAGWCASPNDHNSILLISNLDKSLKL